MDQPPREPGRERKRVAVVGQDSPPSPRTGGGASFTDILAVITRATGVPAPDRRTGVRYIPAVDAVAGLWRGGEGHSVPCSGRLVNVSEGGAAVVFSASAVPPKGAYVI